MKIPAKKGVIIVKIDPRDAFFCMEQSYRETAAADSWGSRDLSSLDPPPPRKKRLVEDRDLTKKVPLLEGGGCPITIGARLTDKSESAFITFLRDNSDMFAWDPSGLPEGTKGGD